MNHHDDPDVFDLFDDPQPQQIHAPVPRPAKRRRVRRGSDGGRLALAGVGLSVALMGALGASFIGLGTVVPWLDLDRDDDAPIVSADEPQEPLRTVVDPGASPAERAIDAVIATKLPLSGWDASKVSTSVAATSLGFGCDPKDGLAPAAARSKSFSRPDGSASVAISVRAYPAGGGAVALDGVRAAAASCRDAYLDHVPSAVGHLGTEVAQVSSGRVSALMWRRGDVLISASVSSHGRAASTGAHAEAFTLLDKTLDQSLADVCVNQSAGAAEAGRSPYLSRAGYKGHFATEKVERIDDGTPPAEDRTKKPVVAIPAESLDVPAVGDLPAAPVPAPTIGPDTLPSPEPLPVVPESPEQPALKQNVNYKIEDLDGPGCGWAFTAQEVPAFDFDAENTARERAVARAEKRLDKRWKAWQRAKMRFYRAYDRYRSSVRAYRSYVRQVSKARDAWAVIETARANYRAALASYEAAVVERDEWLADRAVARAQFRAERAACKARPAPAPEPTPTPTTNPRPTPTPEPEMVCPPVRPDILDAEPPTAPASPIPAPEAQLPSTP